MGDTPQVTILQESTDSELMDNLPNGLDVTQGIENLEGPIYSVHLAFTADPNAPPGITPITVIVHQAGEPDVTVFLNLVVPQPVTLAPNPPSKVTATAVSSSQINLSWDAAPGATGYVVQQFIGGNFKQIASVGGNITSYSVGGLSPGTEYEFRVGAFNSANASNPSFPSGYPTATTLAPKGAPGNFMARTVSKSQVSLSWSKVPGAKGYVIDKLVGGTRKQLERISAKSASVKLSKLSSGTSYTFTVGAVTASGTQYANPVTVTTTAVILAKPAHLVSHPTSTTAVRLSWGRVKGATGYVVDQFYNDAWQQLTTVGSGMTEEVINSLSARRYLRVRGRGAQRLTPGQICHSDYQGLNAIACSGESYVGRREGEPRAEPALRSARLGTSLMLPGSQRSSRA